MRRPDFRPRALLERFGIEVLATTDDPCDDLAHHAAIRDDAAVPTRVLPTFRPDRYLEPGRTDWPELVDALGAAADIDTTDYKGFIAALEDRRRYFVAHGAVSADHSHADVGTAPLDQADAERIFAAAGPAAATAGRGHGAAPPPAAGDGADVGRGRPGDDPAPRRVPQPPHADLRRASARTSGCDIPVAMEFTRGAAAAAGALRHRRRLPPRAVHPRRDGVLPGDRAAGRLLPSVYAGAPWWFLDAPEAIRRYRGAVTETAGFGRTSGFIDDTRAFCSIPARHDMSRRLDCGYLAELVATHRLDEDEALATAHDLVAVNPKVAFKL